MQIDAKVPVHAIDKLAPGLITDVPFSALNHALLPSASARVLTIPADRLIGEVTQQPYYLAEVQVSAEGAHLLGDYKIKAGIPASVTTKTGERTLMSYLSKPLIVRLELAFREYWTIHCRYGIRLVAPYRFLSLLAALFSCNFLPATLLTKSGTIELDFI